MPGSTLHALVCHPGRPDDGGRRIAVTLTPEGDALTLVYRLGGSLAGLALPAPGAALPRERLWAHTCFELFVAGAGETAYREFNFSPGGQWMRFDFAAYRQRSGEPLAPPPGPAPQMHWQRGDDALALTVRLPTACLPAACLPAGPLHLGLTAVVEQADGSHCYWALRHPPGAPDFHHRDGFAVALKGLTP